MLGDQRKNRRRLDLAQADLRRTGGDARPGIGPAAAMKHRQGPEIHALAREPEGDGVAERLEIGAAMAVDRTLRIAGGARGVEQAERLPLVRRARPGIVRVALREQGLVGNRVGDAAGADLHDEDRPGPVGERPGGQRAVLGLDDQHPGAAMVQGERDRRRIEAGVQRVQHGAEHRHGEMRLDHLRHVRREDRHRVEPPDPPRSQPRGEAAAAAIQVGVGQAPRSVDDRNSGPDRGGRPGEQAGGG